MVILNFHLWLILTLLCSPSNFILLKRTCRVIYTCFETSGVKFRYHLTSYRSTTLNENSYVFFRLVDWMTKTVLLRLGDERKCSFGNRIYKSVIGKRVFPKIYKISLSGFLKVHWFQNFDRNMRKSRLLT